ncbi:MAG: hypothetical protein KME17_11210 [Cyanosarcina radialis HA8281-LM2]|nr:hypothetical protein [Cyanosarcina radialis HA8281-LM2]
MADLTRSDRVKLSKRSIVVISGRLSIGSIVSSNTAYAFGAAVRPTELILMSI